MTPEEFANALYQKHAGDLSGSKPDPIATLEGFGWVKNGRNWTSPYFGSSMTEENALKAEANITRMRLSRRVE